LDHSIHSNSNEKAECFTFLSPHFVPSATIPTPVCSPFVIEAALRCKRNRRTI